FGYPKITFTVRSMISVFHVAVPEVSNLRAVDASSEQVMSASLSAGYSSRTNTSVWMCRTL
ncbi:22645_t:CDS:1, partial [Rhizophagus irregularis]